MNSHGEAIELSARQSDGKGATATSEVTPDGANNGDGLYRMLNVRKLFSSQQIFAFSLTYMATWETMNSQMMFALYNGGPQTFAWSILIAYLGALAQAASLAEMASSVPIAGAQYHWTYVLAPPFMKKFTSWLQGWMTWFGWVAILAVIVNLAVLILEAMISLLHPTYVVQTWHTACMMIAMLFLFGLINSFRWTFVFVPPLELIAGVLHVALFVLFIVVLLTLGSRNTTDYIFFHREIFSGWKNEFVSWHLGMLTTVSAFISLDNAVHMSEEVKMAKQAVPRAVFWGIAVNGAMAYVMVICLLSAMGELDEELAYSPFPAAVVLMRTTKSTSATVAMISGIFIIMACSALGCVASVSRLTWAWARDGALPKWFAMVNPEHLLPVRAIWLALILNMALSLINIGSTAAYGAVLSLATITLFSSYGIAILSMLLARYRSTRGLHVLELGEWNLGRYGVYVNAFALLYTSYMTVFLPIPYTLPVTAVNMNYAGPIFAACLIFVITTWFFYGRNKWAGVNEAIVEIVKGEADVVSHTGHTA